LRKYKWTSAKLKPKYPRQPVPIIAFSASPATRQTLCAICDARSPTPVYLQCGHEFCSHCWVEYLEGRINGRGDCNIPCMQDGCSWLIPESFIKGLCGDALYSRFEGICLRQYVERLRYLKFCPAPECTEIVSCRVAANESALETLVPTVTCSNGHAFCFGCHIDSDHRPVLCRIVKLWLDECQKDAEIRPQLTRHKEHIDTLQWIHSHTKKCPGCSSPIQKNGGCK
jgi:ariadne-1